ncbi:MAG: hypothetical protein H7X71_02760 [Chitinophagales bacterium]|nr:hypothetical protein [Chitinophagales bacterium]
MKKTAAIFIFFISTSFVFSQKYITAGGLRMSKNEVGLTVQQHIFETVTVEALAMFNIEEYYFSAMLEKHDKILWGEGFNSYFGAGPRYGKYITDSTYFGADFVFGAEYKMLLFPVVLSADIKPGFRFEQDNWFELGVGVSIRYILIKEKKKKPFENGIFEKRKNN